jgi:glycosyltransferase involved in cell wall biosynthesis
MWNGTRVLVAIPAYNEAPTVGQVVERVRCALPEADVLVVDDGSVDGTAAVLRDLRIPVARHIANLGYGRAIQTAVKYAIEQGYDALVTLDADGQHRPEEVRALLEAFEAGSWDCLVGSRYVATRRYGEAPLGRRLGMQLFSLLTVVMTGRRIYDTTSGLKALRRRAFESLTKWHFVDFHAEALVYLTRLGFTVGEFPIHVEERRHGTSMYNALSHLVYPLKTSTMIVLGAVQASFVTRERRP